MVLFTHSELHLGITYFCDNHFTIDLKLRDLWLCCGVALQTYWTAIRNHSILLGWRLCQASHCELLFVNQCFSKNRPLGRFFLVVAMSIYIYICPLFMSTIYGIGQLGRFDHRVAMSVVCLCVPFPCNFFRGLSLALRSHDQIPASDWAAVSRQKY